MAVLTLTDVRAAADAPARYSEPFDKYAERSIREHRSATKNRSSFDVFLSHSFADRKTILGLRNLLEAAGLVVYVDWIDDADLDRDRVTPATADTLRHRMRQSRSLLYATSPSAQSSRWMPWELGQFDGMKGRVGVLPVDDRTSRRTTYVGQEYLGLYPYVGPCSTGSVRTDLCVFIGADKVPLPDWTRS